MVTRIRLVQEADAAELATLMQANRSFFAKWTPSRPDEYFTLDGQRTEIETTLRAHSAGLAVPCVILRDTRIIGKVALTAIQRGGLSSCTLGYSLSESETGSGHARAAVSQMCATAFGELQLHRVDAGTITTNTASQRVLERNGFERLCVAPRYVMVAERWQDAVLFQRLSDG
jgi:ribosomal-protein-alanine N-acetyltransferase